MQSISLQQPERTNRQQLDYTDYRHPNHHQFTQAFGYLDRLAMQVAYLVHEGDLARGSQIRHVALDFISQNNFNGNHEDEMKRQLRRYYNASYDIASQTLEKGA